MENHLKNYLMHSSLTSGSLNKTKFKKNQKARKPTSNTRFNKKDVKKPRSSRYIKDRDPSGYSRHQFTSTRSNGSKVNDFIEACSIASENGYLIEMRTPYGDTQVATPEAWLEMFENGEKFENYTYIGLVEQ